LSGSVLVHRDDGVARIVIDRPGSRNALTTEMMRQLADVVTALGRDESIGVVLLGATGPDFCAGADLGDISAAISPDPVERASSFTTGLPLNVHPLLRALLALPQPVVAAVRGNVIGLGVMLTLVADLVVASETARFLVPQVSLGHTMDHGESWLLPRCVGAAKAARMSLLAESVSAADAARHGLASWVVPDEELESRSLEIVDRLRTLPAPAVAATKRLLRASLSSSLDDQLSSEVRESARCAATDEFVEAVTAATSRTRRST
jgi:2-(1,2-epoxy-1,2-dihydrophenyl)acetyl-CoA isomerase